MDTHTDTRTRTFIAHPDTMDISGSACRQTEGEVMQSRGRDG